MGTWQLQPRLGDDDSMALHYRSGLRTRWFNIQRIKIQTTYADDHAFSFIKHKTFGMQLLGHIAATASHIFNYKKMKQKKRQKDRRPPI